MGGSVRWYRRVPNHDGGVSSVEYAILAAFIAVCAAMLVLRRREPNAERKFRAPAAIVVSWVGILGCLYLFISLPNRTQLFFVSAQVIGLVLYALYGSRAAERARGARG